MKKELLLVVILLSSFAIALEVPDYKDKYVNDFAGIFTSSQITSMRASLQELDYNTTAEVAVVTIADCGGDYDGFAMKLAEKWKIGKADKDNGLLILYCQAENKITVKTGYGLEGILPDSKLGRMLDEYYVPQRDNGNVQEGIILFTEQVSNEIKNNAEEVISGRKNNSISIWIVFLPLLFIIILFIIFFSIFRKARNLTRQSTKSQTGYENIPELKQKG
ncbi:MAG: TPM domain-containing protein, partial [Nanoarchaeota archaeon]|nr:TPM domain-containing protein [Nanoarchaeota archaeon]